MKQYTNKELYFRGILTLQEVVEAEPEVLEQEWMLVQLEMWFQQDQMKFDKIRIQNETALKYGWTALLVKPS